eukprot:COSAG01_NODE_2447_length_7683_cov_10.152294_3_plen_96_part_00
MCLSNEDENEEGKRPRPDDGRSFVELHEAGETGGPFVRPGAPVQTQVSSKIAAQKAIGEALHAKGKVSQSPVGAHAPCREGSVPQSDTAVPCTHR